MPAGERFFFDTNLLLYWLDPVDQAKHQLARRWVAAVWESGAGGISWQVLNEFYFNAVRKLRAPTPSVRAIVESYVQWRPIGFGLGLIHRAWYWADKAGIPYWDSLIVASAETADCAWLLSEDFQAGQRFDALTVVNPFRTGPAQFGLS